MCIRDREETEEGGSDIEEQFTTTKRKAYDAEDDVAIPKKKALFSLPEIKRVR